MCCCSTSLPSGRSTSTPRGYAGATSSSTYGAAAYSSSYISSLSSAQNGSLTSSRKPYSLSQRGNPSSTNAHQGSGGSILDYYYDSPSSAAAVRLHSGGRANSPAPLSSSGRPRATAAAAEILSASRTLGGSSRLVHGSYQEHLAGSRDGSGR
jgi:hypothetical protein